MTQNYHETLTDAETNKKEDRASHLYHPQAQDQRNSKRLSIPHRADIHGYQRNLRGSVLYRRNVQLWPSSCEERSTSYERPFHWWLTDLLDVFRLYDEVENMPVS